jgi:flagellar biosynthesis protein FlhB
MTELADERTLPPTPKRRSEVIARGDVAHSSLLTSAALLLTVLTWLAASSPTWTAEVGQWWRDQWQQPLSLTGDDAPVERLAEALWTLLTWTSGLGLLGIATVLGVEWVQKGIRVQTARICPDAARLTSGTTRVLAGLNPLLWLSEGLRWTVPTIAMFALLWARRERWAALPHADPVTLLTEGGALGLEVLTRLAAMMLLLALGHYAWRRWKWERALRMTAQEYRAEQERHLHPRKWAAAAGRPPEGLSEIPSLPAQ